MTCIIGLEHEGKIYIGADSAGAKGWEVRQIMIPKVFKNAGFIIGYTTSFRMGQLLMYKLSVEKQKEGMPDFEFMATSFVDAVMKCLKDNGYSKIDDNVATGGDFLVGYRNNIYEVEADYQVNRTADGIMAIGCGGEYALGAMRAINSNDPRKRINASLEIAAYYSGAVIPPFTILEGVPIER